MQRRHFLAGAVGIAAAPLAAKAGPGSSVAPVGRVSTTAWCPSGYYWDGDGCVRSYPQYQTWVGSSYPHEWLGEINTAQMAVGARPIQRNVIPISDPRTDPWFRTQLIPGEYSDINDLANLLEVGGAAGTVIGARYGGARGAGVGVVAGFGGAFLLWFGYNLGVLINKQRTPPPGVLAPQVPIQQIRYGGWTYDTGSAGAYGSGFGFGWSVIQVSGGSDSLLHELY
jgi:hypothetical protein